MASLTETGQLLGVTDKRLHRAIGSGRLRATRTVTPGGMVVWEISPDDAREWYLRDIRLPPRVVEYDPADSVVRIAARLGHTPSAFDLETARKITIKAIHSWFGSYVIFCAS